MGPNQRRIRVSVPESAVDWADPLHVVTLCLHQLGYQIKSILITTVVNCICNIEDVVVKGAACVSTPIHFFCQIPLTAPHGPLSSNCSLSPFPHGHTGSFLCLLKHYKQDGHTLFVLIGWLATDAHIYRCSGYRQTIC